ncbi:MAG TPA: hypothetical protein VLA49_12505 [Anaerolineales bacterium]|nr:hypothetical protein [Anaerolineales bacterium]
MSLTGKPEWLPWLEPQLSCRPLLKPRDAYKLLYQGILGPEHAIASSESFATRLNDELGTVESGWSEPLWESIRPDGTLGRLNLRPFKAQAGDPVELVRACLETARRKWGTLDELVAVWSMVVEANRSAAWAGWKFDQVMEITQLVQANSYPALHHSQAYQAAYQPAYRLVASDLLPGLESTFSK